MNIEISANDYRDLLDIIHIADVILSGHRREPDKRTERHRALIQKLYALAKGEGLDRLIGHDIPTNVYSPTPEFEESTLAHVLIDEFSDHLFWDELIARMAVRDAAREAGGIDRLNAMSDSDRQAAEGPIRQRYIEEFSRNGISNLAVIDRFDLGGHEPVRTSD
ncbi:MAG: hypothetical protein ACYC7L_03070 [Nitrospirota bacterium]